MLMVLSLVVGLSVAASAQTTSQNTMLQNMASDKDLSTVTGAGKERGQMK
jgi:hypothetical protein